MGVEKQIGILDPEGKNKNPLTGKTYQNLYQDSEEPLDVPVLDSKGNIRTDLDGNDITKEGPFTYANISKIIHTLPLLEDKKLTLEIIKLIRDNQVLVIESGTGTGKTVVLPKLALHALDYKKKVVVTVPKTSLAESSASFAAKCMDVELGQEVGFQYRGSIINKTVLDEDGEEGATVDVPVGSYTKETKLLFSTDGMLRAKLTDDKTMEDYGLIMIDEAHERNPNIDLLLLYVREALLINPDLKLIVTSATLEEGLFEKYFRSKGISVASKKVPGKPNKPVDVHYQNVKIRAQDIADRLMDCFFKLIVNKGITKDTLIFVNSAPNAMKICNGIRKKDKRIYCIVATSETIARDDQLVSMATENPKEYKPLKDLYEANNYKQRVMIATDVWESSITLPYLKYVLDSGISLQAAYDGEKMEHSLLNKQIAQAQAIQRKGRVGRKTPGDCYFLYSKEVYEKMPFSKPIPIAVEDMTDFALDFWKREENETLEDVVMFFSKLVSPPPEKNIRASIEILYTLGLSNGIGRKAELTELGFFMASRPYNLNDVKMSKTLYYSRVYKCQMEVSVILAIFSLRKGVSDLFMADKDANKNKIKDKLLHRYQNKYGDLMAGFFAMKAFMEEYYRNSNSKWGRVEDWCRKNYISYRNAIKVQKQALDYYKIRYPTVMPAEVAEEGIHEIEGLHDRIAFCFLKGYLVNLAVKRGKVYQNIIPSKTTTAPLNDIVQVSRNEKYNFMEQKTFYIIYRELNRFDASTNFTDTLGIPDHLIDLLNDFEKDKLGI
jgi:ATP-dependent helicase HrpA